MNAFYDAFEMIPFFVFLFDENHRLPMVYTNISTMLIHRCHCQTFLRPSWTLTRMKRNQVSQHRKLIVSFDLFSVAIFWSHIIFSFYVRPITMIMELESLVRYIKMQLVLWLLCEHVYMTAFQENNAPSFGFLSKTQLAPYCGASQVYQMRDDGEKLSFCLTVYQPQSLNIHRFNKFYIFWCKNNCHCSKNRKNIYFIP